MKYKCDECKKEMESLREFSNLRVGSDIVKFCWDCRNEYSRKHEETYKQPGCKCWEVKYACEQCMKKVRNTRKLGHHQCWNPKYACGECLPLIKKENEKE